jgi:hypothetical protein
MNAPRWLVVMFLVSVTLAGFVYVIGHLHGRPHYSMPARFSSPAGSTCPPFYTVVNEVTHIECVHQQGMP